MDSAVGDDIRRTFEVFLIKHGIQERDAIQIAARVPLFQLKRVCDDVLVHECRPKKDDAPF